MIRVALVLIGCLPVFAADSLDSLLHVQRMRAGSRAAEVFSVLDSSGGFAPTAKELNDLCFLIAYLPLSDLAVITGAELLENVRLAEQAGREFPWGALVTDEMFRHFVLPHRVTQEPYVHGWRRQFHDELAPRVRNLSMTEAALEVNHWCHEKATYQPSDSRDQDPLTTIRAGLGRCEEEMILAICALRSVGIPARQCYTPFWPHMDDNHAWVEVWADGRWHYFGACEPDVALNRAWFTDAAARTMLVVSTAYGDYRGEEPVLRRAGRTTLISSTAVYGPTHTIRIRLEDRRGKPVPRQNIVFSLFNYGAILPAMALETDNKGEASLVCGLGDWFVSAGKDDRAAFRHVTAADTDIVLRLQHPDSLRALTSVEYTPPPAIQKADSLKPDSLFACRLTGEDRFRESCWGMWAREAGVQLDSLPERPDSLRILQIAERCRLDGARVYELMLKARGNWGSLYAFLFGSLPYEEPADDKAARVPARWVVLEQLTDKDARDFTPDVLADHAAHSNLQRSLNETDSTSRDRYQKYVVAPRIDKEPSRAWRGQLHRFLKANPGLVTSAGDKAVIRWLRKNIVVDKDRDRLGPPLTPAECLELRRGSVEDIERLYVGLCRVRETPARFDPVSNRLQRWEDNAWLNVDLGIRDKQRESQIATGFLTLLPADSDSATLGARYNREWAVQRWEGDRFSDFDFGFETAFQDQSWPKQLPAGLYCLTSGVRRSDGSALLSLEWFGVHKDKPAQVTLRFP